MGPGRGSTTVTSQPAARACSAVASPAGPAPATSRSVVTGRPDRPPARQAAAGSARASASAAFSMRIRTVSSQAFSTVKASAVIQAVCTSGSAMPSATTAT